MRHAVFALLGALIGGFGFVLLVMGMATLLDAEWTQGGRVMTILGGLVSSFGGMGGGIAVAEECR